MAYQKQGFLNDMTPRQKRAVAIVSIVVVIVLALGISYWNSPREFMRRFMTKRTYGEWILKREAEKDIPELKKITGEITKERAVNRTSKVQVNLSDELRQQIGSTASLYAVDNYIKNLTVKSNVSIAGTQAYVQAQINDRSGTIMTVDLAKTADFTAFDAKELGLGWQKINSTESGEEEYKSAGGPALELKDPRRVLLWTSDNNKMNRLMKKDLIKGYKDIRKDIKIEIDPEETFEMSGKQARGIRILYSVPVETFLKFIDVSAENMMSNKKLYSAWNENLSDELKFKTFQDYQAFLQSEKRALENNLKESGTTGVAVSLYVDKKNTVTAAEALVKNNKNDLMARAVIRDEKNSGPAVRIRYGENGIYSVIVKKEGERNGTVDLQSGKFERTVSYSDFQWQNGHLFGNFKWKTGDIPFGKDGKKIRISNTLSILKKGKDSQSINLTMDFPSIGMISFETASEKGKFSMPDFSAIKNAAPLDGSRVTEALTRYLTSELPAKDPEYANLLRQIVRSQVPTGKLAASAITQRQQERRQVYQLLINKFLEKRAAGKQQNSVKKETATVVTDEEDKKKDSSEEKTTGSADKNQAETENAAA